MTVVMIMMSNYHDQFLHLSFRYQTIFSFLFRDVFFCSLAVISFIAIVHFERYNIYTLFTCIDIFIQSERKIKDLFNKNPIELFCVK